MTATTIERPASGEMTLLFQHSSLQFSDTAAQQASDINDLFEAKDAAKFVIKTGTEAGPDGDANNANRRLLIEACRDHKHRLHFARDNFIAVDKSIIVPGSVLPGDVFVADNDETAGHGHDSVFATMAFQHRMPGVGVIGLGAGHLPTQGRKPGDPNYDINVRYSNYVGRWARHAARGSALAFFIADYNRADRKGRGSDRDWLIGDQRLTGLPDDVGGPWEDTGHGPIDGMMSFDGDGRVKGKWVNVLNDREFPQFSDHHVVRGAYTVRLLAA